MIRIQDFAIDTPTQNQNGFMRRLAVDIILFQGDRG